MGDCSQAKDGAAVSERRGRQRALRPDSASEAGRRGEPRGGLVRGLGREKGLPLNVPR